MKDDSKTINIDKMTKTEIAKAFSKREFEKTYGFISDNAEWRVVEENSFKGKQVIIDNCSQVSSFFKSVTTDFKTLNVIADGRKVVINGTAEFLRNNKRISYVSACDIYEFNDKTVIKLGYDFGLVESTCLSINEIWSGLKFTHSKKGKVYNNSYGKLNPATMQFQRKSNCNNTHDSIVHERGFCFYCPGFQHGG